MDKMVWRIIIIFGVVHIVTASTYSVNARNARSALLGSIDSNVRPTQLVEVNIAFNLLAITRMVSDENLMSAVGWFTVTWTDTSVSWDTSQPTLNMTSLHFKEGEIWRPELRVENAVNDVDILANQHHTFRVLENGTVTWALATQMDVHCLQDLTYYPFDKQKCYVTLTSWSHDVSEVILRSSMGSVDLTYFSENAEWTIDTETTVVLSNMTTTTGGVAMENSRITFYLSLSRTSNLLGLTFLFPLILLSLLTILVFVLPVASGEKVTYCAVTMVSIVVFFTSTVEYFPMSKAVPIRVTYITVVLVLACLSVLCTFVVVWLHYQRPDKPMPQNTINILNFLNKITCVSVPYIDSCGQDAKPVETIPETSGTTDHQPKHLIPIQNGGGHLTTAPSAPTLDPIERLPPVNEHLRKNKIRPKSGESVYSVNKKKGRPVNSSNNNNWQNLADRLDAFLLILFVCLSILVHFIFLVTLSAGGKDSEP